MFFLLRILFFITLFIVPIATFSTEYSNTSVSSEADITYRIILKLQHPDNLTQNRLTQLSIQLKLPIPLKLVRHMSGQADLVEMDPAQLKIVLTQTQSTKLALFNQVLTILNDPKYNYLIKYASVDRILHYEKPEISFKKLADFFDYHRLQWDEFNAPGGVELESAPGLKDLAWQLTMGSPEIIVAVIDTGVDSNLDLNANVLPGWNFPAGNNDVSDVTNDCLNNGSCHGTHVAGTVAAIGDNGIITHMPMGMGTNLKILPENVFTSGGATTADIIDAMHWAVGDPVPGVPNNPYPAQVLNLSLGSSLPSSCAGAQQDAVTSVKQKALIIVAAGNSDMPAGDYTMSNCEGVVAVAATDSNGLRASYSNYGSDVSIAAPGGKDNYSPDGILSTTRSNSFLYLAGTSMAAPHVAGIAGLIYSYAHTLQLTLTPDNVKNLLLANVNAFGTSSDPDFNCDPQGIKSCGVGIVNAFASLKAVQSQDKAVFIPPPQSALNLQNHAGVVICQTGLLIPALKTGATLPVQDKGYTAYWQIVSAGCAVPSTYTSPVIEGAAMITLRYGNKNTFTFIPPAGLSCRVIANSSVGCI